MKLVFNGPAIKDSSFLQWEKWMRVKPCPKAGEGVHHWIYFACKAAHEYGLDLGDVEDAITNMITRPAQQGEIDRAFYSEVDKETVNLADPDVDPLKVEQCPENWKLREFEPNISAEEQTITHLKYCFQPRESVCICPLHTSKTYPDGGYIKTQKEWLAKISAITDKRWLGGVQIRINPTTGSKDSDVTDYRYCLVEGDKQTTNRQIKILLKSQLPIRLMLHSGKKSIHAWIAIKGHSFREYHIKRKRIWLYLQKLGLKLDWSARNPSRYSRIAGASREGKLQQLLYIGGFDRAAEKQQ